MNKKSKGVFSTMKKLKTVLVFSSVLVLLLVVALNSSAQATPTPTTPVGQQTVAYCLPSSGSYTPSACVAKWNADTNRALLCPPNHTPVLDHCTAPQGSSECATATASGQECYCKYRCVPIPSTLPPTRKDD